MSINCPRCNAEVEALSPVDNGLRQRLSLAGVTENLPAALCSKCYSEVETMVGTGSVLLAQLKVKEERKVDLWKSRVKLLKKARSCMLQKAYAEAAVTYEKYIKVVEIVFEITHEKFTPELFKDRAATKELTVLASMYWDLMRIYDTNEKYRQRQNLAAQKLSLFLPYTPISSDIIRKAEQFKKSAKNPAIFSEFLKTGSKRKSGCFIATQVYGDPYSYEVLRLRLFRDYVLINYFWGKLFIEFYYFAAPFIAPLIGKNPFIKKIFKKVIDRLLLLIKY